MMPITLEHDTICAISTAPGVGGIAVARVSGPEAIDVVQKIWKGKPLADIAPRTAHLGAISDSRGEVLDHAVVTTFRAPASFTGEDVVEVSVHGSVWIQRELIDALINAGARLAEPGEFTRRAFASGRIDLVEAEGIADMIASTSRASHRLALSQMRGGLSRRLTGLRDSLIDLASLLELELDFSEEDVEFASRSRLLETATTTHNEVERLKHSFAAGSAIRNGIPVAIVGATNVGKSSLLNALVEDDRAIVSDIHGTTRDIVEDTINIGDFTFRILDTAGLRNTADTIEALGIERSYEAISHARIVILVIDASHPFPTDIAHDTAENMQPGSHLIVARNKTDLLTTQPEDYTIAVNTDSDIPVDIVTISAKTGAGIDNLRALMKQAAGADIADADVVITNARHHRALHLAQQSLAGVIRGLNSNLSGDFIAQDLREAIHHLGEITGDVTPADILTTIFSRFCIGK